MLTEQNLTVINSNQVLIHEFNEYTNEHYDGVGFGEGQNVYRLNS